MGKVFCVGLSKTGTKTLARCLEILGYDHFGWREGLTERVLTGSVEEAFEIADSHESFDDWPWPALYLELDERYPDARFILTVRRDVDTWFRSLVAHADRVGPTAERRLTFGCDHPEDDEKEVKRLYERHNREVRSHFRDRPGKLVELCWEAGSGWEDLCGFLGEPVPAVSLPHENRTPRPTLLSRLRKALLPTR